MRYSGIGIYYSMVTYDMTHDNTSATDARTIYLRYRSTFTHIDSGVIFFVTSHANKSDAQDHNIQSKVSQNEKCTKPLPAENISRIHIQPEIHQIFRRSH